MGELWMELGMGGSVLPWSALGSTCLQRLYILVCSLGHPAAGQNRSLPMLLVAGCGSLVKEKVLVLQIVTVYAAFKELYR